MPALDLHTLLELVGDLKDTPESDGASKRFREYLRKNVHDFQDVRNYINIALSTSGDSYNKALQDLVNHVGELLGFSVTYGRYRGVKNDIGFDGLWESSTGWSIVVEVKTTDTYQVKTATLLNYINSLISSGKIKNSQKVVGLYVYGRYDNQTASLEHAIVGEGRRETLRVISTDALLMLLELKQRYGLDHEVVLQLFLPAPVRVDPLVTLIFDIVVEHEEDFTPEKQTRQVQIQQVSDQSDGMPGLVHISESYVGKTPTFVIFQGERYPVSTWKTALLKVVEILSQRNPTDFEHVASNITGRKRPYFTPDPDKLRAAVGIPGTSLYVETNLSANSIVKLCRTLVKAMGYEDAMLQFEAKA